MPKVVQAVAANFGFLVRINSRSRFREKSVCSRPQALPGNEFDPCQRQGPSSLLQCRVTLTESAPRGAHLSGVP